MTTATAPGETFLEERIALDRLQELLLPVGEWRPHPTIEDREGWAAVPDSVRQQLLDKAESLLAWEWPQLPATLFLEYARIGNRINYETPHFERRRNLATLVLAECLEAEGRFLDQIINGLWAICEESFWGVPAHNRPRFYEGSGLPDVDDPYLDLFVAETGNVVAWTWYLLRSRLGQELPVLVNRLERELQKRILTPYRERDDWVWLGFVEREERAHPNNWNPWIHSNVLTVSLLTEQDADARAATVAKCIRGIDRFLGGYHPDGGCDEGISYWGRAGASLFDCLDVLASASAGRIDLFGEPLIQEIGRYAYRMHIGGQWFVNFADGSAKTDLDGNLVYRYGRQIGDPHMIALGIEAAEYTPVLPPRIASMGRALAELLDPTPRDTTPDVPSFVRDTWLPGVQVLAAHESGETMDGLFLAAKGGNNAESHNHNDIGSFIVGVGGRPVIIDAGVETYSRKTFSPQRYEIWTMQSGYHNLPTVNSQDQLPGLHYAASEANISIGDDVTALDLEIAPAWGPEAGIRTWHRRAELMRGASAAVTVTDTWDLEAVTGDLVWNLVVADEPDISTAGSFIASHEGRQLRVGYDGNLLTAEKERIPITDGRLGAVWGEAVWRVRLTHTAPPAAGTLVLRFERN